MERIHGLMDKNRIRGAADRDERANDREVAVAKGTWRRSGGRVEKASVLTRGDPASGLKGPRVFTHAEREVSRGHSRSRSRRRAGNGG